MQTVQLITRQRRWQKVRKSEGKCVICGKPQDPGSTNHCVKHREIIRRRTAISRMPKDEFPEDLWSKALDAFLNPITDESN